MSLVFVFFLKLTLFKTKVSIPFCLDFEEGKKEFSYHLVIS